MMLWGFVHRGWVKMGMEESVRLGGPLSPEADRARGEVGADSRTDFLLGAGLEPDFWAGGARRARSQPLHAGVAQPAWRPKIDTGCPRNVT